MTEKMMNHFHQNVTRKYSFSMAKMKNARHYKFQIFSRNNGNVVLLNFIITRLFVFLRLYHYWNNIPYCWFFAFLSRLVQVNLCQKLLFLHQLTHNMTTDCSELQVQYMKIPSSNLGRTCCVQKLFLTFKTILVHRWKVKKSREFKSKFWFQKKNQIVTRT